MSELDKILNELNLGLEKQKEIKEKIKAVFINLAVVCQEDMEIGSSGLDMLLDPMKEL